MALVNDIPMMLKAWKQNATLLKHNAELFDIFEGNLLDHLLETLKGQLNEQSFIEASKRAAPINVLKRLIDKLSKIYEKPPTREVVGGDDEEKTLLDKYVEAFDINTVLGGADGANHLFNLFKNVWIEPYLDQDQGTPQLRVIPSDRFFVISVNPVCPTKPTHFVKIMGTIRVDAKAERTLFYAYTDTEFLAFDDQGEVRTEIMNQIGNPEGINPLGTLPGEYICRSKYNLMPIRDTDTLAMSKLLPVLLTDLNYALMYQTFGIVYTIDVNQAGLKWAPNALLDLKSDQGSDKPPQVGSIKPEVDSDKALNMIRALFSLWMETRNIKPGSMGELSAENLASGVSKIIDEMDTSGDRQAQVPFFKKGEESLWKKVFGNFHPYWSNEEGFALKGLKFSPSASVKVTFAEQRPVVNESQAIDDQIKKIGADLETRKGALKALNPDWTDEQVDQKIAEIDAEKKANADKLAAQGAAPGAEAPKAAPPTDPATTEALGATA